MPQQWSQGTLKETLRLISLNATSLLNEPHPETGPEITRYLNNISVDLYQLSLQARILAIHAFMATRPPLYDVPKTERILQSAKVQPQHDNSPRRQDVRRARRIRRANRP